MILKTLGLAVIPEIVNMLGKLLNKGYSAIFDDAIPPVRVIPTQEECKYIIHIHNIMEGTQDDHVKFFNSKFNWNQNRTFYAYIWQGKRNVSKLVKGDPIK